MSPARKGERVGSECSWSTARDRAGCEALDRESPFSGQQIGYTHTIHGDLSRLEIDLDGGDRIAGRGSRKELSSRLGQECANFPSPGNFLALHRTLRTPAGEGQSDRELLDRSIDCISRPPLFRAAAGKHPGGRVRAIRIAQNLARLMAEEDAIRGVPSHGIPRRLTLEISRALGSPDHMDELLPNAIEAYGCEWDRLAAATVGRRV